MTTDPELQRSSRFINVGDVAIHALDWGGDGIPLILVHGALRTGRSWNAVARRLHDVFRVIALDLRGHGDSGATTTGNDSHSRMNDIAYVATELDLGSHFIMAHSLGCVPVGLYASHHAGRVKGLILVEPVMDVHAFWTRGETSKSTWMEKASAGRRNGWASIDELRSRLGQNRATKAWASEVTEDVLREETRLFPDGRVEIKWHPSIYNLNEMWDDRTSLIDEAPRIVMPALVLARADNPQLESNLKPFSSALPQGTINILPNLGHSMYMEAPGLIADIARRFFA
ncbi:MAG: alpha/beta hydrolase [Dehalococcoidia bacterium]|nr:alpha/beta hydrolase [Dehalococcoidia bacterium]